MPSKPDRNGAWPNDHDDLVVRPSNWGVVLDLDPDLELDLDLDCFFRPRRWAQPSLSGPRSFGSPSPGGSGFEPRSTNHEPPSFGVGGPSGSRNGTSRA